ncbi:hypothetical protein [Gymnodinialimonas hymeniacidonis]|uniref:hypothetical protein n=1 Tax=Gymnodinialimonas hymeniacidonis TaxID=3126508 RepID=UPI0034C68099
MRLATTLPVCSVTATPVWAQMILDDINSIIVEENANHGLHVALAHMLADCFTDNMTEAEAETIMAADGHQARQDAVASMAGYDAAMECTAAAFQ